jgi:hypothetical protein
VALVVAHGPAVGQDEIDPLGAVERAAAPEPDDRIDAARCGMHPARLDHARVGVRIEVVERTGCDAGLAQNRLHTANQSRGHDAGVGHDQGPGKAAFAGQFAKT